MKLRTLFHAHDWRLMKAADAEITSRSAFFKQPWIEHGRVYLYACKCGQRKAEFRNNLNRRETINPDMFD
jgi:predicted SprT family Zn-dependent metalloprotease